MSQKMMLAALAGTCFVTAAATAVAEEPPVFETETVAAAGGPIGFAFSTPKYPDLVVPATLFVAQRFRSPRYTPLAVEASYVVAIGYGITGLVDVFHTDDVRVHLDVGWFRQQWGRLNVPQVPRDWDLAAGLGVEVNVSDSVRVTLDWRAYLPDPISLAYNMGYLARPIINESLTGGEAWLGIALPW
jgi:hypothetical protein